jgi:hypothetical protein
MGKKKENHPILQITISAVAIIVAIIHLVWPSLTIDAITITLLVISIFPWLQPLIKSFELPGGWKIEFQDIQKARIKAERAGLLSPQPRGGGGTPTLFQVSVKEDPILLFSSLRLEIESKMRDLASLHNISANEMNLWDLMNALRMGSVLTSEEGDALKDIISILNSGLHGAYINKEAIDWVLDIGPRIIGVLIDKEEASG